MKQIVNRLRMTLPLVLIFVFWGIFVSMTPSDSDGAAKSFPSLYRTPMDKM